MPAPETNPAQAYLRTRVMTASPVELRLMLLDGALRFARQGQEGLAQKDYERSYTGITQCRAILLELATNLRREADPALCDRVHGLYMFLYQELVQASLEKSAERVGKVVGILEYERETWAMLMEKLREGSGAPAAAAAGPEGAPARAGGTLRLSA